MRGHWNPDDTQTKRRRAVNEDCDGDMLKAARLLLGIAKQTRGDTRRKAINDYNYFLRLARYRR